ncbi:MAG: hypothetical protein HRF45_08765, partial [Fimbriimonadia bacterium]
MWLDETPMFLDQLLLDDQAFPQRLNERNGIVAMGYHTGGTPVPPPSVAMGYHTGGTPVPPPSV